MRHLLLIAGVLASLSLWLFLAPLQPAAPAAHRAARPRPALALPVVAVASALGAAAIVAPAARTPKKIDAPALVRRLDEQIPAQLYAAAAGCYQGGLPADQRLDLSYRVRVVRGEVSITEAGVTSGVLGDGAVQRCIVDRVLGFQDHDDQLPDLEEDGQLYLRVGGFKPFLAQVAEDGDQPPPL